MVFHWSLSDSKSPEVSMTLLSILAVLNNVVFWMVSTRPSTSKSFSPFSNPLFTVPNAPITIGIIVTCMFHSFFNSLARSRYLSFFSHSFSFILWSLWAFHISVSWRSFTWVWVTANLLKSPGLFSIFRPSTNYNWCNRQFHVPQFFFNSLARSRYLSLFSLNFNFTLWSAETAKSTILPVLSFLLIIIRSGRLAEIRWSVRISKSQWSLCVSFSRVYSGLCIYNLFVWSNINFLHNFRWIPLPTRSCLALYSFCAFIYVIDGFVTINA